MSKEERKRLEEVMVPVAMRVLEGLLVEEGVRTAVLASRQVIEAKMRRLVRTAVIPEHGEGRRIYSARERASQGTLSYVRTVGAQALFVGELGQHEYVSITTNWISSWLDANREWKKVGLVNVWRCGGALVAIGDENLESIRIR